MKHTLLLLLMLFSMELLYAQRSSTFSYPDLTGDKVLVAKNPADGNDVVCRMDNNLYPTFFYHDQSTGATTRLPIK